MFLLDHNRYPKRPAALGPDNITDEVCTARRRPAAHRMWPAAG